MRNIGAKLRSDFVRNLTEFVELKRARVSSSATPDDLWTNLASQTPNLIKINAVVVASHTIATALEVAARDTHVPAVSQVATRGKRKTKYWIARITECKIDG